ncbi:MAG: efflux RND transporter periplasmic adaptor subunit [Candidatus Rokubacteria bacterium]|nr:efflux RND transporter periplasmic adaptor subunit [Candidatus Rokubacteria bacterium]
MAFVRRHRVTLVLLALLAVMAVVVVLRYREQQARAVTRPPREVVVGVAKPERRDLEVTLSYTADILPNRQTPIFAKTSGYIRTIRADKGDFVKAGQPLVEIEPTEMEAGLDQARAALATAAAGLQVARSNLEAARASLLNQQAALARTQALLANDRRQAERMAELFAKGLVAAQERDNARTAYEASQAVVRAQEAQVQAARVQIGTTESQVTLAEAQVDQQRAALRMAQMRLDDTRLTAPFAGYISQKNLDVGAAVSSQAAATSNASVAILILQEIDPVKVQIEVPEREVARVRLGNTVRLTADAYPDRRFAGVVKRIIHALDPRTRTMGLEVEIPNPGQLLKPGMYARVQLVLEIQRGALLVPLEAVTGGETRPAVLVVRDGKVVTTPVALGVTDGPSVQVTRGLQPDDAVIVQGKELVREGQTVKAVPAKTS